MRLTPDVLYEMEMTIYLQESTKYETLRNEPYHFLLAKPEPPSLPRGQSHWDMRKIITGSRRRWK